LADHANGLKDSLVLGNAMTESPLKDQEVLNPSIERLVAGSSPTLELSQFCWIMGAWGTDTVLSTVPLVTNDLLASRNHVVEVFAEDCDVMLSGWEGSIHPDKSILVD
jgi:hypothetical protein